MALLPKPSKLPKPPDENNEKNCMNNEKPQPDGSMTDAEIEAKRKELVAENKEATRAYSEAEDRELAKLDKKALSSRDFLLGASMIAAAIWHAEPDTESPSIGSIEVKTRKLFSLAVEILNDCEDGDLFDLRDQRDSVREDLEKLRHKKAQGKSDKR